MLPKHRFIDSQDAFEKLWTSWTVEDSPEAPLVDFKKEIILVGIIGGPNSGTLVANVDSHGHVRVGILQTLVGGDGNRFVMCRVSRKRIKTVDGQPIDDEYAQIEVRGRLVLGRPSLGAPHTAASVQSKGVSWDLSLSDEIEPRLDGLAGRLVTFKGVLDVKRGQKLHWMLDVTSIQAVPQKLPK